MAIGSKSARMTLAEGLAFLTSAMSWIGPGPARAARKSRTGGAEAAWTSISSSGIRCRAAATSRRFEATISSRIELGTVILPYFLYILAFKAVHVFDVFYVFHEFAHRSVQNSVQRILSPGTLGTPPR